MYKTIKKLSLGFIFLNLFMFQSLKADMMFYYNAAILPSIIASKQQVPVALTAEADFAQPQAIENVSIDVLANDTIPEGSTINILFEEYQDVYTDVVQRYEGFWLVDGNTVTFTPNPDFSGGQVDIWYQLTDQYGNTSKNYIIIQYPVFVQAYQDEISPASIEPVNIPVLANDTNSSPITTILFETYGEYGPIYVGNLDTFEGNWSIESNLSVSFTPNANYGGGSIWRTYQIMDQDGHTSKNDIHINYPIFVYAEHDYLQPSTIEQTTINVLENDTVTGGSIVSVLLENYDYNTGQVEYVDNVSGYGGTWIVDLSSVVFIPDVNFAGGGVGISYQIIDDQGRVSQNYIYLEFPLYVQANYDYKQATEVEAVTVDVLANDTVGDGVTPTILLEAHDINGPIYVDRLEQYDGVWNVEANQSVTFTPNENFNSRNIGIQYQLSDNDGRTSQAGINIEYPVEIYAEGDYVQSTVIEPVTVDVLANDINTSAVTVRLNNQTDLSIVEALDGNWSVEANQSVTFTPNANYGGGAVWMSYQITDEQGRTSENWVGIEYPVYIYAEWDQVEASGIETVIVDVLVNDMYTPDVTVELVNYNFEMNSYEAGATITTEEGVWSVNGLDVIFEPGVEFGGGSVSMQYQITDDEGYMSRNSIQIIYPIAPSPVCTVTQLTTVEEIYNTLTASLSFDYDNGVRRFEPELDIRKYTIDSSFYTDSTAVTGINPMYMVWYEERSYMTYVGDTFTQVTQAELNPVRIDINDNNGTWSYEEQKSANDRGYKYVGSQGESGTYVVESDGSNTLNIEGEDVFSFKIVREISESEINNVLENSGIMLTLESGDTAQLQLTKELMSDYDWWGSVNGDTYDSLNDFIASNEYNSSATQFYNTVLHTQTWEKGIIFAEGSTGQSSGTLIEIEKQSNTILVSNAGEWQIENITDNDENTYDIIVVNPILCGYEKRIFRLDGSTILQGQRDEAGIIGAELGFSSTLNDKLTTYFINEAPVDIDPDNPNSPEITENMLSGKVFYTVNDRGDGTKDFEKITVDSPSLISLREILVDEQGTIMAENSGTIGYRLENGRIRVENGQDTKIWLNSDPVDGDWSVTMADWSYMDQKTWLLDEPVDFPQ